jgi:hypothetical protein
MSTSCGFNLIRNARMFFTTNVDSCSGAVLTDGFTAANTKEIQVLDGLSFSQATSSETVTLNEAGDSPSRGQRSFNTALEPVELTFSTYMRPYYTENTSTSGFDTDDYVAAEEDVLWNAFAAGKDNGTNEQIGTPLAVGASKPAAGTAGHSSAWTAYYGDDTPSVEPKSVVGFNFSGKNQMVNFGVIITLDSTAYIIDNCVLDQASIDFGLDAISTIAWTARGSRLRSVNLYASQASGGVVTFTGNYLTGPTVAVPTTLTGVTVTTAAVFTYAAHGLRVGMEVEVTAGTSDLAGGTYYVISTPTANTFKLSASVAGSSVTIGTAGNLDIDFNADAAADVAKAKVTTAPFLANKLSVVTLEKGIGGGGKSYSLALTGGNITLSNNVTYLTPANLGTVNQPFTYFTGTRAISGSINCYLKTGSSNSAGLLEDMLASSTTDVEPAYKLKVSMGNPDTSGKVRVVLELPAAVLTIPAINTEQVVSSTVNFTAQGYDDASDVFSICANNEATITYYSAVC